MHESSIATNIVAIVNEEAQKRNIESKVKKVLFKAARLSAIIPDSLKFYFDFLKENDPHLKDAELVVEQVPLKVTCSKCKKSFELEEPIFLCPTCEGPLKIDDARQMWVESITFEDS